MNFAMVMFILLVITGVIALWDRIAGRPKRLQKAEALEKSGKTDEGALEDAAKEPLLVEYAKAFFPVILAVFLLRSFVVEPFRIPSGSMLPSLVVGDFILVNKFTYGVRLPILHMKIFDVNTPKRGDVMVFRYPYEPSVNYIKRVIGLPGDHIVYTKKHLYINGKEVSYDKETKYRFEEAGRRVIDAIRVKEKLPGHSHDILWDPRKSQYPLEFDVPAGKYFVMGDNRDYSNDSRYWGYVSDDLVVGKAFLIWFSLDMANGGGVNWGRIGDLID
jgi:signal peptidase I